MTKDKGRDANVAPFRKRNPATAKAQNTNGSVERAIGSRLRAYYDEVAREPIPDRFVELLKRLNEQDSGSN